MKKIKRMSLALAIIVLISCLFASTAFAADIGKFKDVPSNAWYYKELNYATASRKTMLDNFVSLLSYYSGKNIKGYFSANEWNSILSALNS